MNFVDFLKKVRGITPPLPDQYGDWLGYEIENPKDDRRLIRTHLTIRQEHLSPSGAVHGGVISGFLDFTCGCVVFMNLDPDKLCSTVDLNVKYFQPLKEGDEVIAEAKILHKGRSLASATASLFQKETPQTWIAMASGTFNIYSIPKTLRS